jgi:hypothetical protein
MPSLRRDITEAIRPHESIQGTIDGKVTPCLIFPLIRCNNIYF